MTWILPSRNNLFESDLTFGPEWSRSRVTIEPGDRLTASATSLAVHKGYMFLRSDL